MKLHYVSKAEGGYFYGERCWVVEDGRFLVLRPLRSLSGFEPYWVLRPRLSSRYSESSEARLLSEYGLTDACFNSRARALEALSLALQGEREAC